MCGRFALGLPRPYIIRAVHDENPELDMDPDEWVDEDAFHPRFNIAPRTRSPVIRRRNCFDDRSANVGDGEAAVAVAEGDSEQKGKWTGSGSVMHTMKWGLVPHWSKHEDTSLNTINAKGENLIEGGGMWTSIKGKKRCAVVCQGYYEWLKKGKSRLPHFTRHKDGKLMLLAGLYDSVILEGSSEPLYTFTIVTTDANKQLSWLHDRMPVVLGSPAQVAAWLDTSEQTWTPKVAKIIRPFISPKKEHDLECYPVPLDVGKVSAESSTFIEPIHKRKDGIEAMFSKQSKGKEEKAIDGKSSPSSSREKVKRDETDTGRHGSAKRKRSSPERVQKDRESSVEILNTDDSLSTKKPRTDTEGQISESPNPAESSGKTSMETQIKEPTSSHKSSQKAKTRPPDSSPKSRAKSTKAPKSPEQASPETSKITNFFSKG